METEAYQVGNQTPCHWIIQMHTHIHASGWELVRQSICGDYKYQPQDNTLASQLQASS